MVTVEKCRCGSRKVVRSPAEMLVDAGEAKDGPKVRTDIEASVVRWYEDESVKGSEGGRAYKPLAGQAAH